MQAQQSNTAAGPGKANTSFFASIRAAAAAQQQAVAHPSQPSASLHGPEDSTDFTDDLTAFPHDSERSDPRPNQIQLGVSPALDDWKTDQASLNVAAEERTAHPMSARPGKTLRIDAQAASHTVLSRLINSASADRMWRNASSIGDPAQRRFSRDQLNSAGRSHPSPANQIRPEAPAAKKNSLGETKADIGPVLDVKQKPSREQSIRAGLAHDAKSLLSALKLYSEMLAVPEVLSQEHKHYATDLKSLAERSWVLVERLIALEGATDMEQACTRNETNLVDVLTGCRGLLDTLAAGALEVNFGYQAALPVPASAESLERILVNLVNNATEATRDQGAIRIQVGVESHPSDYDIQARRRSSEVMVLTVDDSGCGMTERQIQELSREKSAQPGQRRGIGLQVVQSLVAASGGTIGLQSRIGVGTRVEIRWPLDGSSKSGIDVWNDNLTGGSAAMVQGVIGRMEMVAEAEEGLETGYRAPFTDSPLNAKLLLLNEQTRTWSHEKEGSLLRVEGRSRGSAGDLGSADTSASTHTSAPFNLSRGAIVC